MNAAPEDERLAAAVLAGLGSLSRARLAAVLSHHRPLLALERLVAGAALHPAVGLSGEVHSRLVEQARTAEPCEIARRLTDAGIAVCLLGDPTYPAALAADPEAPAVLFARGRPAALGNRRVAIVGTRNATAAGRATAVELGRGLAAAGVTVVSGLALGIDAAAHQGALDAGQESGTVAVVGNGLDEAYPRRNRDLFDRLCAEQLVLSEWPPGTAPEAFRFPLRNRIIAALAEVLVVVESRERGGSLITARAALDRGIDVMVVPGSPRTRAATGTNQLLRDGAAPVTCVDDVLDVLSITGSRTGAAAPATLSVDDRVAAAVLERCRSGPATLDALVLAGAAPIATVAATVATLLAQGHLTEEAGWIEAAGSRLSGSCRP